MPTNIEIIFTTSQSLISRLIRWVTRSPVSHAAIGGFSLAGVEVFLHADVGGVQVTPKAHFFADRQPYAVFRVKDEVIHNLSDAVRDIGERYDYLGLVGHLIRTVTRYLGWAIKRPLTSPRAVVCSEFVARLNLASFATLDPEKTTPKDLLAVCLASSELEQIFPAKRA